MRKSALVAVGLIMALAIAIPAVGREWIPRPMVVAAEQVLATMPADFYQVDPTAVRGLMDTAKPFVLDVRELAEWQAERIDGSIHIPIRDLPKMLDRLPEDRGVPIIIVCKVGYRSGITMTILRMWGYTNVRAMRGGLDAWKAANLPVTK